MDWEVDTRAKASIQLRKTIEQLRVEIEDLRSGLGIGRSTDQRFNV